MSAETVIIPRNFVLLEELEKAEKGATDMAISYGLIMADDISLSDWQCTIIGPQNSAVDNRVINLVVRCGPKYPTEAPEALFQTKVNYPFVVRAACHTLNSPLVVRARRMPHLSAHDKSLLAAHAAA
jgi:ubiquitin-protein ligase